MCKKTDCHPQNDLLFLCTKPCHRPHRRTLLMYSICVRVLVCLYGLKSLPLTPGPGLTYSCRKCERWFTMIFTISSFFENAYLTLRTITWKNGHYILFKFKAFAAFYFRSHNTESKRYYSKQAFRTVVFYVFVCVVLCCSFLSTGNLNELGFFTFIRF